MTAFCQTVDPATGGASANKTSSWPACPRSSWLTRFCVREPCVVVKRDTN